MEHQVQRPNIQAIDEVHQQLEASFMRRNDFFKKSLKPPSKLPYDEQGLALFIDWLLQPPKYRIYSYKSPGLEPKDMKDFISGLLRPLPHQAFCDRLLELKSREFEILVAELLRSLGGEITVSLPGGDRGIDLTWRTSAGNYIIQCKRWKNKIHPSIIRDLNGVVTAFKVQGKFIVTNSEFTEGAVISAEESDPRIGLIDGQELFNFLSWISPHVIADVIEGRWKANKS